jgi:nucleotide-binding universal stress UspA family protein
MIKKILLAVDSDEDSIVASRVAVDLAVRFDAEISCMAVIDLESIESGSRGGGIGSFYQADRLADRLTDETREVARSLITEYDERLSAADVRHASVIKEGVPVARIVEDMKVHDILVLGKRPHFFYAHPKQDTATVARVVRQIVAPALVVGRAYTPVRKVLMAYDGGDASARAIASFLHLQPFGSDVSVEVVTVFDKSPEESELLVGLMKEYVSAHGLEVHASSLSGSSPKVEIIKHAENTKCDLIVAGANRVSAVERIIFGKTAVALLEDSPLPVFIQS